MGVARQRPGEVEHAQERQRHVAHLLAEVEAVEVHRRELGPHGVDVGAGEAQVLGHGEVGHEGRVLEDRRQPEAMGVGRPAQIDRSAGDRHRAGVGAQHAGEDLDERRLAGAVGAEQGVHLAGGDDEVDAAQRHHGAERLGHRGGGEQRRRAVRWRARHGERRLGDRGVWMWCVHGAARHRSGRPGTDGAARPGSSGAAGAWNAGWRGVRPVYSPGPLQSNSCWGVKVV